MTTQILVKQTFDTNKAEQFEDMVANMINSGATTLMISLGHKTKLFDAMSDLSASSSMHIAKCANLDERYVREWLSVMVVSNIVEYNAAEKTYYLPDEHATYLTTNETNINLAASAQFIPMMAKVEDTIQQCFITGNGTQYNDYECFHHVMAEDSEQTVVDGIVETLKQLTPDVYSRLETGISVLDVGCGSGKAMIKLASLFSPSSYHGYDICEDVIIEAKSNARNSGVCNISFKVQDTVSLHDSARYDLVTSFDAIHDTKSPQQVVNNVYRALKSGGTYIMQDIGGSAYLENNLDFPFAAFLYTVSCTHCTPVSIGQGGQGLGSMWGWETAQDMLKIAGFTDIQKHVLPHDPMNIWFVSRKT